MKKNKKLIIIVWILILFFLLVWSYFIDKEKNEYLISIDIEEKNNVNNPIDYEDVVKELRNEYQNDDIVGILNIENTDYRVPILQGEDNDYYLNHTPDGKENFMGSIYLDYRVDIDSSRKLLIYGHNSSRIDMPFKILEEFYDIDYYNNHKNVSIITTNTEKKYEIFSVYVETGDFETTEKKAATKQNNQPDGKSMATNMNKNVGLSYMQFKGIEDMNNFISKYSFTQEDLNIITGTYKTALQDKGIMITVDNRMRGIKFNVAGDVELTAETKSAVLITLGMVSKTGFIEATVGADKKVVEINVLLDVIAKANDLAKVDDPDLYLRIINEMDKQTSSQKKSIDFSKVKDIADKVEALQAAKDITEEDLKNLPDNTAEVAVNAITAINNAIAGTVEFYNNILGARKAFTTMYASIFGNKK